MTLEHAVAVLLAQTVDAAIGHDKLPVHAGGESPVKKILSPFPEAGCKLRVMVWTNHRGP